MQNKKVPLRTCIVTKEKLPKKELLRIVRFDGKVFVDQTGKSNGKGCYIKKDIEVLNKLKKSKMLERVLETSIDESIYEEIEKILS